MHAKVQREIAEHDETSSEAEPSNRHLVAENASIWHLNVVTPTSRPGIVPTRIGDIQTDVGRPLLKTPHSLVSVLSWSPSPATESAAHRCFAAHRRLMSAGLSERKSGNRAV